MGTGRAHRRCSTASSAIGFSGLCSHVFGICLHPQNNLMYISVQRELCETGKSDGLYVAGGCVCSSISNTSKK